MPKIELTSHIEADLTDEEKEDAVKQWLFLTTWLNEITDREYKTAEDVLNMVFELVG